MESADPQGSAVIRGFRVWRHALACEIKSSCAYSDAELPNLTEVTGKVFFNPRGDVRGRKFADVFWV